jgi:L-methionine (R)-S-oxide reductase
VPEAFTNQSSAVRRKLVDILDGDNDGPGKLQEIADALHELISHYNWVGFYLALPGTRTLVLGPFAGEPTEHTHIEYGRGICGQAAETRSTFVVKDVSKEDNYLSCSIKVKSEIVVPIFREGTVVGEIDIDSHRRDAFTEADTVFLEELARTAEQLIPIDFP